MKKILRLCLVPLMALMSSSNLFAMETQPITQESEGLTANPVTYNVSFSNYKLTPKEYVMSNGGISIFINSTTSFPNETISFELFHNGNRTGKIKSVPLQSGQYVSWGDFPAGNYEIRITSSKADYYNNVYVSATLRVIYGN